MEMEYDTEDEVEIDVNMDMDVKSTNITYTKDDANFMVLEGKYDEAISIYSDMIKNNNQDNRDNAILYSNRSVAYHKLGYYDMALRDCIQVTKLKPEWGKAWGRLGANLYKLGKLSDALTAYNKANELEYNIIYLDMIKKIEHENNNSTDIMDQMISAMLDSNVLMEKMMDSNFQSKILSMQDDPFKAMNDSEIMGLMDNIISKITINEKDIVNMSKNINDMSNLEKKVKDKVKKYGKTAN
jgi:tetratricopeptide (TPR) repeat protein